MEDGGTGRTDATIFESHGLLTDQCVMAHGVWLTDTDLELLQRRQTAVAHCPLSNFFFAGGCLPTRRLLTRGNRVGLATDVAGGYSPSMWNASRVAVVASRALEHAQIITIHQAGTSPEPPGDNGTTFSSSSSSSSSPQLDYRHAFYLATLGGAEALNLANHIGTFAPGMELDALVLTVAPPIQVFEQDTVADVFQKLCVLGDDRHVASVYVQGRKVK